MTRKHSTRRPRPVSAPMLINRGMQETEIEIHELMIVEAFVNGTATTWHFDSLCDMRNVLVLAAAYKDDASAKAVCDAMRMAICGRRNQRCGSQCLLTADMRGRKSAACSGPSRWIGCAAIRAER